MQHHIFTNCTHTAEPSMCCIRNRLSSLSQHLISYLVLHMIRSKCILSHKFLSLILLRLMSSVRFAYLYPPFLIQTSRVLHTTRSMRNPQTTQHLKYSDARSASVGSRSRRCAPDLMLWGRVGFNGEFKIRRSHAPGSTGPTAQNAGKDHEHALCSLRIRINSLFHPSRPLSYLPAIPHNRGPTSVRLRQGSGMLLTSLTSHRPD